MLQEERRRAQYKFNLKYISSRIRSSWQAAVTANIDTDSSLPIEEEEAKGKAFN